MTPLVDQLADLTALRDRESLDSALLATLHELLHPAHMAIHRLVGPSSNERWLTCAQMQDGAAQGQSGGIRHRTRAPAFPAAN